MVELRATVKLGFIKDDIDWGLYCGLQEGGGTGVGENGGMLMEGKSVCVCERERACVSVCVFKVAKLITQISYLELKYHKLINVQ